MFSLPIIFVSGCWKQVWPLYLILFLHATNEPYIQYWINGCILIARRQKDKKTFFTEVVGLLDCKLCE